MYKIVEDNEQLAAVHYDNHKDIRIHICFVKGDRGAMNDAIKTFWKHYKRLSANKRLLDII